MPEQERAPEIQQEAIIAKIDQELEKEPTFKNPLDLENYGSLSRNKEVALAGLMLTIGVLASPEAKAEFYYNRPENVKPNEQQILQNFKEGDENTVYRYGKELLDLTEARAKQKEESIEAGESGRAIIKQLSRIMMFCKRHGVEFQDVYDISKINPDFVKAARREFIQAFMISEQEDQKPLAQKGFEKTRPEQEKLARKSR